MIFFYPNPSPRFGPKSKTLAPSFLLLILCLLLALAERFNADQLRVLLLVLASYSDRGGPTNGSVYVCKLPLGADETMLVEYFGTIGLIKPDRRTGQPKIWIYRDKITNEPKGDATVTYEDPHAALAAVERFHNKDFHGSIIEVYMAQLKTKDSGDQSYGQQVNHAADPAMDGDFGGQEDVNGGGGKGRGRGVASAKAWQQDVDWLCPNTRSVISILLCQCKFCLSWGV